VTEEQVRALKTITMVLDLALGVWVLWMILPPAMKLDIQAAVKGELGKVGAAKRRRTVERQMEFDLLMAMSAVTDYDRHRDPEKFARDLALTV
jgi:hypothetical protein